MKNYTVYIEQDEDGVLIGSVPSIPGCYTQANTQEELIQNLKEVVSLCVSNLEEGEQNQFVGVQNIKLAA